MTTDVIQSNQARGGLGTDGFGPESNNGSGGRLNAVTGTVVTKDLLTAANLANDTDSNNDEDNNSGSGGPI